MYSIVLCKQVRGSILLISDNKAGEIANKNDIMVLNIPAFLLACKQMRIWIGMIPLRFNEMKIRLEKENCDMLINLRNNKCPNTNCSHSVWDSWASQPSS